MRQSPTGESVGKYVCSYIYFHLVAFIVVDFWGDSGPYWGGIVTLLNGVVASTEGTCVLAEGSCGPTEWSCGSYWVELWPYWMEFRPLLSGLVSILRGIVAVLSGVLAPTESSWGPYWVELRPLLSGLVSLLRGLVSLLRGNHESAEGTSTWWGHLFIFEEPNKSTLIKYFFVSLSTPDERERVSDCTIILPGSVQKCITAHGTSLHCCKNCGRVFQFR